MSEDPTIEIHEGKAGGCALIVAAFFAGLIGLSVVGYLQSTRCAELCGGNVECWERCDD